MQLGISGIGDIGKNLFPEWSAALTLVKDNGLGAANHARQAITTGDTSQRLDHAVLALTGLDHAIDNTRKLPVSYFVPNADQIYRGYDAAKQAVMLLVSTGVVPGAKQRLGGQSLVAGKEAFLAGVDISRTEQTRFGRHLAAGWLEATAEDALTGVTMLGATDTGRALLAGISQARTAVQQNRAIDDLLARSVSDLFDRARTELSMIVDEAVAKYASMPPADVMCRTAELLGTAEAAAKVLVADADKVVLKPAG